MGNRDWWEWHKPYQDPSSALSMRMSVVTGHLRASLDGCPPGPIKLISLCAGQGRDVISVLGDHPRRGDVTARLIELDPRNVQRARQAADRLDAASVVVIRADAGVTNAYVGAVPANVILACGIYGNISAGDIERTIDTLPSLCAPDATVIWTRHRRPPDLTPTIRSWYQAAGFVERAFEGPSGAFFGVGVHQFVSEPRPIEPGQRVFTFVNPDAATVH
jgi:hypothetical protein